MKKDIPIFRPNMPHLGTLSSLFDEIHAAGIYSNNGPLLKRFEEQFAQRCSSDLHISGQANGTLALQTAILATAGFAKVPKNNCLMPAFTFSATASAALAAGYKLHFTDVNPDTWMQDPDNLRNHPMLETTGLIVVTAAFGVMPDLEAWAQFSKETAIPVVIDGASCSDAFLGGHIRKTHNLPVALSFHATKPFALGEGGAVISSQQSDIEAARACANFGFDADRRSKLVGTNSKMSEIVAAIGLITLKIWEDQRKDYRYVANRYQERLAGHKGFKMQSKWATVYAHILADDEADRTKIINRMDQARIDHRRWWGFGCHTHPAYSEFGKDALPVTEDISARMIGLPFYPLMSREDIDRVTNTLLR